MYARILLLAVVLPLLILAIPACSGGDSGKTSPTSAGKGPNPGDRKENPPQ